MNKSRCPYHSFHRDGQMRVDGNYGSYTSYEPNSEGAWQEQPEFAEPPLKISGDAARWNYPCDDADYFEQPGKLFRLMSPEQKEALFGNTARALGDAPKEIKLRHIRNCAKADPAYGAGVAKPAAFLKAKSEPFQRKLSLTQFTYFKHELLSRRHARAAGADPRTPPDFSGGVFRAARTRAD